MNVYHRQLGHRAGDLIATSAVIGLFAIGVRASWGGAPARALEGATLSLAAAAYVAHALARHETTRELLTRSILVSAFALWGLVQTAPGLPGNATLNDVVIVLFVVDLAILVSPLALSARPSADADPARLKAECRGVPHPPPSCPSVPHVLDRPSTRKKKPSGSPASLWLARPGTVGRAGWMLDQNGMPFAAVTYEASVVDGVLAAPGRARPLGALEITAPP